MGFFDSVMLVGGPVFYKIMLIINIIAIGIANIMNAQMASSRLLYSMGRDGVIPKAFGKVHPKYQTPWFSAVFLGVVTLCLSIPMGDKMTQLAGLVNFGALPRSSCSTSPCSCSSSSARRSATPSATS